MSHTIRNIKKHDGKHKIVRNKTRMLLAPTKECGKIGSYEVTIKISSISLHVNNK